MKIKKVKFPVYKTILYVCITEDEDEAKRYFRKQNINIENWGKTTEAHTWTLSGFYPFVWLRGVKTKKQIGTLCHEITHACWFILKDVGISLSEDNHEALTYMQSYAINQILK